MRALRSAHILLAFVLLGPMFVPAREPKPLRWTPKPSLVALWTAEGPRVFPPGGPLVSLKVATPLAHPRLRVLSTTWRVIPRGVPFEVSSPPVSLGARGIHRGIPYVEVLVRPLRPSEKPGTARILVDLCFSLEGSAPSDGAARVGNPASPPVEGFLNGGDARRLLGALPSFTPNPGRGQATWARPESLSGSVRISVSKPGIYRLTRGDLPASVTAGDPRLLHLSCMGVELPILVEGEEDGSFDPGDAVVFYGEPPPLSPRPLWNGGRYTDTNVYRLMEGTDPGSRMAPLDGTPGQGETPITSIFSTLHFEKSGFIDTVDHLRPLGDLWFWAPILVAWKGDSVSQDYALDLPHYAGGSVKLDSPFASITSADHAVAVALNGTSPIDGPSPLGWTGKKVVSGTWTFPSAQSGQNTLTVTLPGFPTQFDLVVPDSFDLTYTRLLQADGGALTMKVPPDSALYKAEDFSSPPLILDLSVKDGATGLALPRRIENATYSSGSVSFAVVEEGGTDRREVALADTLPSPDAVEECLSRDLTDPSLGADLLVITHPSLHPEGADQAWVEYLQRRRAEMSVEVVDIQEVYDNFSWGLFDPTAIRTFLRAAAAAWSTVPKYVLLVGDGTYDYENGKEEPGFVNLVPTMMFEDLTDYTYMGRFASDSWYADLDGDGYPDMAVGRLPARNYDELAGMLTKIKAYEDQELSGSWYRTGLFIADTFNQAWEQEFEFYNDYLRTTFMAPPWGNTHVYFHDPPFNGTDADTCATAIRDQWPGSALVHYSGHSGIAFWGNHRDIFTSYPSRNCDEGTCADSDVDLLPPVTKGPAPFAPLPFVINSSCYNSAFNETGDPSLMEALVARADGGAIGSCGFTTIAYQTEEETFNNAVFGQAFGMIKVRRLGDLVDAGRFALPASVARDVMGNVLLGDPTLALRLPAPPPPSALQAEAEDSAVLLSWHAPPLDPGGLTLYRSSDGETTWSLVAHMDPAAVQYLDTPLTNGTSYSYYVTATDTGGFEGPPSNVASATPAPTPCTVTCTADAPDTATAGIPAFFSAQASTDHCAGEPAFDWAYGDGSPHGVEADVSHAFAGAGSYGWTLTASVDGAICVKSGTVEVVAPPAITLVKTASSPFRVILKGANFQGDIQVFVQGTPWSQIKVKGTTKIVLLKGSALKDRFPPGTAVPIVLLNGDGGEATVLFDRQSGQWQREGGLFYPPFVSGVSKASSPFRIVIKGAEFHPDLTVLIQGQPWEDFTFKSSAKIVLKGGAALKAAFPDDTDVPVTLENGDGGWTSFLYNRTVNAWEPAG